MTAHFFKRFGSRSELSLLMFHKILTQRVLSLDLSHDHCKAMLTIRKLDLDKKKKQESNNNKKDRGTRLCTYYFLGLGNNLSHNALEMGLASSLFKSPPFHCHSFQSL